MLRPAWSAVFLFALATLWCDPLAADPPPDSRPLTPDSSSLHARIDSLIESAAIGPLALLCTDADFVRRIYLDLTGVIPTAQQARDFVVDTSENKRQRLIDDLLATPAFIRHMTITLDVMLMERKPEKVVKQTEWESYLYNSLAADKPLDQLFRELIAADTPVGQAASLPTPPVGQAASLPDDLRPAARFILDRDAEPNLITRDIGRLAFGMDLQCCQCHDHPLIDDYYQDDYYGLFAFVHRTTLFTDAKSKLISLTEKADGEASFKSVFTGASSDKALPRLPKGAVLFVEPTFDKGEEYTVKPDKTVRGIPKYSRRAALAEMVPTSREFSRNLANRLWATMFGRGIVHPLDFHYAANPPSNPELLTQLADALVSGQSANCNPQSAIPSPYQLRPFLRKLVMTRAYQRSCEPPSPDTLNFADIAARQEKLTRDKAELQKSIAPLQQSLAGAKSAFKSAREEDAALVASLPNLEKPIADARQALEKIAAERHAAQQIAATIQRESNAIADAAKKLVAAAQSLPADTTLASAAQQITAQSTTLVEIASQAATATAEPSTTQADAAQDLANAEATLAAALARHESAVGNALRSIPGTLRQLETAQIDTQHKLADANYAIAACDAQIAAAQSILDYNRLSKTDPVKAAAAWTAIVEKWTITGQVAALKPLTPEQFATSSLQATGMLDAQLTAATARAEKSLPEALRATKQVADKLKISFVFDSVSHLIAHGSQSTNPTAEAEARRLRSLAQQRELLTQLRPTFTEFVRQYGGLPGEEFQATVNQALFFGNGNTIDAWLKPAGENLVARLTKLDDIEVLTNQMVWSIHSRPPTDAERHAATAYLKNRPDDKPTAITEMLWALLSSTEFRFNH